MAESIEREARYIDINKISIPKGFFNDLNVPKLFDWLNSQPAADVVEVVRCEKCLFYEKVEYYHPTDKNPTKNVCRLLKRQMQPNDFCSYGERRCEE